MKITRSIFNLDQPEETEAEKQFEKFADNPSEILREHRKRMGPMVDLIKVTVSTKGWVEVIQPFLERHSNSNIIFSLFRKKGDEVEKAYATGKAEAYHNLLRLIENILKFDLPEKKEDEEKPE